MAATLSSPLAFSRRFQRILTSVLLWLFLLARVNAQHQSGEVQTLLKIKNLMDVDGSTVSKGYWKTWNGTDKDPCAWWGVICTDNSTVEQISLSGWELTHMPPRLGIFSNLTDLRSLDLSFNNFRDKDGEPTITIPDDIGSLVGLTRLVLSYNAFTGPLPSTISACRNLRYINIEYNLLSGELPDLSGLVNLQFLYIGWNLFTGPFPKWVGQLNRLLVIELAGNMLNGTIPSLPNLTNLLEVLIQNNSFTGFDEPIFPGANNLEHLSVRMNLLQGPIPLSITELVNLRELDLSINQLSGLIPSGFSLNMSDAVLMDLSHNQLTGNIPQNLLQPTLQAITRPVLNFSYNFLEGPIPFDGTKQYHYQILDFSSNSLSGLIPSICNNGSSFINQLWLQNNQLEGDIVDFLYQCYSCITELKLSNNSLGGDLSRMANSINRTSLDLVREESKLQIIDLSDNNLQMSTSEANSDPLRTVLEYFVLNTSVKEFRMQGNDLSGTPLPKYFSLPATSLQVLDLSSTHLVGEIWDAAFNSTWLPALQFLYLSDNDLTGPIPEAVVMISNLIVLDVTNNSLSGPLPAVLPNKLDPRFFAGNGGLCGGPLHACSQGTGVQWWVLCSVIGGSVIIAVGSCLVVTWRWRLYHKMHQQDADLIKTLLERETAELMSLRELKKATNNFAEDARIGEGGFGIVYTGKLTDGTIVAIKRSKCEGFEKDKNQFLNEVRILTQVNHRHLVKLLGCCMENKTALLVFEFVSNGTLQEHLTGKKGGIRLSWEQRLHIAIQTADALNYLHSAAVFPIYHRDVKSGNILLDNDLNAKVTDFGISKLVPLEATHVSTVAIQGTIGYIDPEYYTSYQLTDKSDVYSFGVVLLELISAKPAIDFLRGEEKTSLVNFSSRHIENGDLQQLIDASLMETYNDLAGLGRESILNVGRLAMKCLQMRSKVRPSMHEVWKALQNIWFELQGISKDFCSSTSDDDSKDSPREHVVLLSDSFSCNSSSFSIQIDP